ARRRRWPSTTRCAPPPRWSRPTSSASSPAPSADDHKRTSADRLASRPSQPVDRPWSSRVPAETHVEHGPIGRDEIFELIRDRLADILEIDPSTISEGQSFADDLEADSLALIELVEAIEEELGERTVGFRIDDEDLEDLKTVRDAVDYVHGRVGQDS